MREATLGALELDAGRVPLGAPDRVRAWTDDYASIVPLLRWWQDGEQRSGMETTMRRHPEIH